MTVGFRAFARAAPRTATEQIPATTTMVHRMNREEGDEMAGVLFIRDPAVVGTVTVFMVTGLYTALKDPPDFRSSPRTRRADLYQL